MKKLLLSLLVLVAPTICFLVAYSGGRGLLARESALFLGVGIMFTLPFLVSIILAWLGWKSWTGRLLAFVGATCVQFAIMFIVFPPMAEAEMFGIGYRLKREFPPSELRRCAESLLQKHQQGTLSASKAGDGFHPAFGYETVVVADSELPEKLRGRFRSVGVDVRQVGPRVIFEVEPQIGVICGTPTPSKALRHHQIADGVFAYRYQRP
jgi:hypothetical protein